MYLSAYAMFNHFFFLFLFLFLVFSYLDSDQSIQHQLHACTNCQKHMPRPRIQWTFNRTIIFICCYKMEKVCFWIKNQVKKSFLIPIFSGDSHFSLYILFLPFLVHILKNASRFSFCRYIRNGNYTTDKRHALLA